MRRFLRSLYSIVVTISLLLAPAWVLAAGISPADLPDGSYQVSVDLTGGSGRAGVTSPCEVTISQGQALAFIEWSSPNYDYMIVDGEKYLAVNTDGNSCFEIPVTLFDEPMDVIGDTLAMSTPHEIEYQLTFHSDGIAAPEVPSAISGKSIIWPLVLLLAAAAACIYYKKKETA